MHQVIHVRFVFNSQDHKTTENLMPAVVSVCRGEHTRDKGPGTGQNTRLPYPKHVETVMEIINTVFPETTDKLGVIRLMENFATHLNTAYPPFEFTSITFQESKKEKGYTVLI